MTIKCRYADRYKAIRPPKCGCNFCTDKFFIHDTVRKLQKRISELEQRVYFGGHQ